MDRHKFILSWMMAAYGALSVILLALIMPRVYAQFVETNTIIFGTQGLSQFQWGMSIAVIMASLTIFFSGVVSLKTKSIKHKLGLVAACLLLISFPVGTALGAYYLWCRYIYFGQNNT